jgi:hypothetical protein
VDDNTLDRTGGHPTVPGDLDPKVIRTQGQPSPGNGVPGKPRYKSLQTRHSGGVLGTFLGGVKQSGVDYDDGSGD